MTRKRKPYTTQRLARIADRLGIDVPELLIRIAQAREPMPNSSHTGNGLGFNDLLGVSADMPEQELAMAFCDGKVILPADLLRAAAKVRTERLTAQAKEMRRRGAKGGTRSKLTPELAREAYEHGCARTGNKIRGNMRAACDWLSKHHKIIVTEKTLSNYLR